MITSYKENSYIVKDLIKNISVFLPLLALLTLVNYLADPAQILKQGYYEQGMAEILLKGLNVANISNYDERLVQKHYIAGLTQKKDVIVLGSSRAMQITSTLFRNASFFNHGVSGATLEDYMAIFEMYQEKSQEPDIVVLGLDPWVLNKNNGQPRWRSIGDYYERFMSRLGMEGNSSGNIFTLQSEELFRIKRYLQIISLSYFQSSIRYLEDHFRYSKDKGSQYYPTDLTDLEVNVLVSDGSYNYKKEHREVSASEALKAAQDYASRKTVYSLGEFHELDSVLMSKFEKFLDYLLEKDIKVIFYLPPYHPYLYNYLVTPYKYKIILEVEVYFRRLASRNNITVIGSYNPENCTLGNGDFYDAMHAKRESVARLWNNSIDHYFYFSYN